MTQDELEEGVWRSVDVFDDYGTKMVLQQKGDDHRVMPVGVLIRQ